MEHNDFYLTRYNNFIARCELPSNETYFELHHIVPKCMGGTDAPDNLVKLTARQHFIAHWMLWKAYKTSSLAYAFFLMNVENKNHAGRYKRINSKTFSLLREHKSAIQSKKNSERWQHKEWADKQRAILSKAASTDKERERRSILARTTNEKYKDHRSKAHTDRWSDPVWANKTKKSMIENHPRTRAVIVDGVEYKKAEHVAEKFNIGKSTVRDRINSSNPLFAGWKYKS